MIRPKLLTVTDGGDIYIGEQIFDEPIQTTWEVPLSVRRIHVCCIGAGGSFGSNGSIQGGGGGGLVWANDIEVQPGEKLRVQVGRVADDTAAHSFIVRPYDPDDPDFNSPSDLIARADGGIRAQGGSYVLGSGITGGGGRGGNGSLGGNSMANGYIYGTFYGAGGGAAGYTGNGGGGGVPGGSPGENSGGASGGTQYYRTSGVLQGTKRGGVGGGVGIKGRGATAASPGDQGDSNEALDGLPGSGGEGPKFGGGDSWPGSRGGNGAVRIIWGIQYSYPDNADVTQ